MTTIPRLVPGVHTTRPCRMLPLSPFLQLFPCRFALRRQQSTRDFGGEAGCSVVEASLRTPLLPSHWRLKTTSQKLSQVCGECVTCATLHLQQQLTHCSPWTYFKVLAENRHSFDEINRMQWAGLIHWEMLINMLNELWYSWDNIGQRSLCEVPCEASWSFCVFLSFDVICLCILCYVSAMALPFFMWGAAKGAALLTASQCSAQWSAPGSSEPQHRCIRKELRIDAPWKPMEHSYGTPSNPEGSAKAAKTSKWMQLDAIGA